VDKHDRLALSFVEKGDLYVVVSKVRHVVTVRIVALSAYRHRCFFRNTDLP
jgi:hypothetical protein